MESQVEGQLSEPRPNKRMIRRAHGKADNTRLGELERLAQVAKVMELLEVTRKDKDWLIDQIRLNHLKVPLKPSMGPVAILNACSKNFIIHILNVLKFSEIDKFEGPPPLTSTYHWFF